MLMRIASRRKQSGVTLLVLAIIIAFTTSIYYFQSISIIDIEIENAEQTRAALKQAKQALINYAVMHGNAVDAIGNGDPGEYGYLPCPYQNDAVGLNDDGAQEAVCDATHVNSIGLFPWVSMETNVLRDGDGNCLWYVVSGGYKNSPGSGLINEDTNGAARIVDSGNNIIVGNDPADRVVALVIAPGKPLAAQVRPYNDDLACGHDGSNPAAYLEGNGVTDNSALQGLAFATDSFISADLASDDADVAVPYNDWIITITREEIWQAVSAANLETDLQNVTHALARCMETYAASNPQGRLPWPAPLAADDYRDETDYDDVAVAAQGYAGRLPLTVDDSNAAIAIAASDSFLDDAVAGGLCTAVDIGGGIIVDFSNPLDKYRNLLINWKDHFFYVVSKSFEPDAAAYTGCGDCITVDGIQRAALVMFSGSPLAGQSRVYDDLLGTDDKADVSNYIEPNDANFPDATGNGNYQLATQNDIMYCFNTVNPPTAAAC
jgi:type II secretory pathway pseudopilin PulG